MHRFIYVSHASDEVGLGTLGDICAVANARNRLDDLTGVLLWAEGVFFQMLEGPTLELDATISRITADPRHSGMTRLAYREVSEITCGYWDMGCFPMRKSDFQADFFDTLSVEALVHKFSSTPDTDLDEFFKTFYQNNIERIRPR